MNSFKRILIAVDNTPCTDKVVHYANEFFISTDSTVALVTVIPPTSPATYGADSLLGQQPIIVPEITEIQQESAEEFVKNIASKIYSAKELYTFAKIGSIKQEILSLAEEWAADLIIMGSNGRSGFDHFISGSVSESVIRKSHCPVFVIPVHCD